MTLAAAEPPDTPLVEARAVGRSFGPTVALRGVDLTVTPGRSHALVGRNGAGKSTLVSLLTGLAAPDTGEIRFSGKPAPRLSDRAAWRENVACVYQRSTAVPQLSVAENLYLNRQPTNSLGLIDQRRLRRTASELLEQWQVTVDVRRRMDDLSVEERQLVEIARALSFGARFIVLDEPTAQLDNAEIERLFARMRALQESGVTFLYISHHLGEIYEVCSEVTVLRDAERVLTSPVSELESSRLVTAMTGTAEQLTSAVAAPRVSGETPARLELDQLGGSAFHGVNLRVRQGEVLGLAGSSASGKVELAETVAGLRAATAGRVRLDGEPLATGDVPAALAAGVGCVPRDRHDQGLVSELSVGENAGMTVAGGFGPAGVIPPGRSRAFARRMIGELDVHTEGPEQPVNALSGGNQQKVVMARALAGRPRLLVLINPTAGVDVKSKESLLAVIDEVRAQGTAVIVVSDELDDLRRCDRVAVLYHGRVTAEHPAGWRDAELVASIEGITQ